MTRKRAWLLGVSAFCVVIVTVIALTICTNWKRTISIERGQWVANGYLNAGTVGGSVLDTYQKGNPYDEYTITNETSHDLVDVTIVFKCEKNLFYKKKKWEYEYDVGKLGAHETKTIKVYHWDMFSGMEDEFGEEKQEVKRITYKVN